MTCVYCGGEIFPEDPIVEDEANGAYRHGWCENKPEPKTPIVHEADRFIIEDETTDPPIGG